MLNVICMLTILLLVGCAHGLVANTKSSKDTECLNGYSGDHSVVIFCNSSNKVYFVKKVGGHTRSGIRVRPTEFIKEHIHGDPGVCAKIGEEGEDLDDGRRISYFKQGRIIMVQSPLIDGHCGSDGVYND